MPPFIYDIRNVADNFVLQEDNSEPNCAKSIAKPLSHEEVTRLKWLHIARD